MSALPDAYINRPLGITTYDEGGAMSGLTWAEMLSFVGAGGVATKAVDIFAQRTKAKAYTMGAVDHAVQTAMKLVTERLEKVEGQHEACETQLVEVKNRLDNSERERRDLREEISSLMRGNVPEYSLEEMARLGRKV